MHEHKYRAWDTQYNRWAYFTLAHLISGDVTGIAQRCKNWCEGTSLKDKNGVEIYEGDIMRFGASVTGGMILDTYYPDRVISWKPDTAGFDLLQEAVSDCWEVIGNIYENPELLEGQS